MSGGGGLAETNLLAGPMCIPAPPQHFYSRELELLRGVYVCEEPEPLMAEATRCVLETG